MEKKEKPSFAGERWETDPSGATDAEGPNYAKPVMRILGEKWSGGYLDFHRGPRECRIKVQLWERVGPVTDMYFVLTQDWRVLLNYLREVGLRQVIRKVISRRREKLRNDKHLSCGIGQVIECDHGSPFQKGCLVAFLAPSHPRCIDRVTLAEEFIRPIENLPITANLPEDSLAFLENAGTELLHPNWFRFAGWNNFSGEALDCAQLDRVLREIQQHLSTIAESKLTLLPCSNGEPVETHEVPRPLRPGQKSAVLFGYGHYAKTNLIPNLHSNIVLERVHEIDPAQIGTDLSLYSYDTSPWPRNSEQYDVFLIAGFHHTHAPLAVEALNSGAYAVVEKPIATTAEQLQLLLRAAECFFRKIFRRFSQTLFNLERLDVARFQS